MKRLLLLTLSTIGLILASLPGNAASPSSREGRPSSSVSLAFSGNTPCSRTGFYAIDSVINRDGSFSPFAIPDGTALMITNMDVPGMLMLDNGTNFTNLLGPRYTTTDTHYDDLVVYPGVRICAYGGTLNELKAYRVRGHLLRDL